MTALVALMAGIVGGWVWQSARYHRLLNRSWPWLLVPPIANPQPPVPGDGREKAE